MYKLELLPEHKGNMRAFRQWLIENRYTTASFARDHGMEQWQISGYLTGKRKPTLKNAVRIARVTDQVVPVEGWV